MAVYTDFHHLSRPTSPNYYLACPHNYCNIKPDVVSPTYMLPVQKLEQLWLLSIKNEPRFTLRDQKDSQYEYVQRSLVFRFPDNVSVRFVSLSQDMSSLAILSRSQYGYYDFAVNKRRVTRLLKQLTSVVSAYNQR